MRHVSYRTWFVALLIFVPAFIAGGIATEGSCHGAEGLRVDEIITCDSSDNPQAVFEPGDDIRIKVNFTLDGPIALVLVHGAIAGTNFEQSLVWQYGVLGEGSYTTVWDASIPADAATGIATVNVTYIGIIDEIVTSEATFSISESAGGEPTSVGSDTCKLCHSDVYASLQESLHVFIECETCHGPGSRHVGSPSAGSITVDTSAELCGRCHSRGDAQNRVEAQGGLIRHNQQYDELQTGGKAAFKCVRCHDPHVSLSSDPGNAIIADCSACHTESINQFHESAGVDCIDCHMPMAVKKETSTGEGDYLKGDTRSHLFSIDPVAEPAAMFYQEAGTTYANGFLTLNFTCLGCHDGSYGKKHDFNWAVQAATLIHAD